MGAADEEPMEGSSDGEEKIFVSVRLRPLNEKELARNGVSDWECINDNTIIYRNNLTVSERSMYPTAYTFDRVFRPDCSTRQVYEEGAKKVALSVVSGINSTVFAYGQTSSGKTYTMSGITEYTVSDIYEYIDKHMEREFILKFSAMEIYNESVRDLLSTDETPLRLLDDPERGTVVERLTEETVRDWSHFRELLSICEAQRQIGETNLNEASSRSHQILRLTIESSAHELLGNDKSSSLAATVNFVDLAGSERASQSLSAGMRLKEGCHINRSLLTLGTVIRKLSKGRTGHIPFRDSKLTRILQSSLGGNARTAIICTMSPARIHVEQSRNTLLFASCAKEVTTNAQVNVVVSDKALVKQLQRELARLESELKRPHSVSSDTSEVLREKDIQIEQLTKEVIELTQRLNQAQIQIEDLLQAAADVRHPPPTIEPDHEYPKLRVQNSWMLENSVSYSSISEHIQSINAGIRSSNAPKSQCSDRESTSSSTENSVHLTEFDGQFQQADSSPEPSIKSASSIGNEVNKEDTEDETEENFDTICKEVQCIQVDEPNGKRYETSTMLELSPSRYADSNTSSPKDSKVVSGLTEVEYHYEENEKSVSRPIKEHNGKTDVHSASAFIIPSPEKHSPWTFDETPSYTKLSLKKSRSCRARLTSNSPTCWFEKLQNNDCVPVNISFARRSEVCENELSTFNYEPDIKNISAKDSETSICSAAPEERTVQAIETPTECKSTTTGKSDAAIILVDDDQVEEPKSEPIVSEKAVKEVKDIGLDPIPDDAENVPQWPLEFKKLQGEIIELWHACNISLIHRTFFFMLFKGDPSDSFYIEVELKRLLFLKNTFSRGDKTIVNGQILTLKSSKRALDAERQMLRRQIKKRLTREERENLFLKWGISLNSSNRRVQLTSYLWSKTDLDHVTDSATLVAKLIGFEEQEKPLKEIFGLLNFTPKRLSRRKSVFSLL